MGRIEGKVCIVTGAAMGLGSAAAATLAREGAHVIVADIDEVGEAFAEETGANFVRHDVRDEEAWASLVAMVEQRFGRIDALINNAGVLRTGDIESATLADWRFVNSVNVEGTFLGCKHTIPAMRRSGGGSIVNVASTVAIMGFPGAVAYTASKGAIVSLTRAIAVECMQRPELIRCNAIYPHLADSPMSRAHAPAEVIAPASGVANAVLFLVSDESSDLNGTFLNLDRGTACIVGELPPRAGDQPR